MVAIWVALVILFSCFGLIVLVGAPYVPNLQKDINDLFGNLKLKRGSEFIDLGSGDGRVLIAAAKKGYRAIGYELNPILWLVSYFRTMKYRKSIHVYLKNLWRADISKVDVVFIFSAQPFLKKLTKKLYSEMKKNSQIISYGFKLPMKKPSQRIGAYFIYSVK